MTTIIFLVLIIIVIIIAIVISVVEPSSREAHHTGVNVDRVDGQIGVVVLEEADELAATYAGQKRGGVGGRVGGREGGEGRGERRGWG